jgi:hypothetical protein
MLACMVWRWRDAGALQYLARTTPPPDWVALVPAPVDRPDWVPAHATGHLMADGDTAWTWHDQPSTQADA